jgi:hypothetical protein
MCKVLCCSMARCLCFLRRMVLVGCSGSLVVALDFWWLLPLWGPAVFIHFLYSAYAGEHKTRPGAGVCLFVSAFHVLLHPTHACDP